MHVLLLHQNFPAQFGPLLSRLGGQPGWKFTFASRTGDGELPGVERLRFATKGGATEQTHYFSRTFENVAWHSAALYKALRERKDFKPDLIVSHSGFVTALPLRDLYPDCKVVNLFEYYYHARDSDLDFRPDDPPAEPDRIRARFRNAAILLDLDNCDAAYCPTNWQRSLFPTEYQPKIDVIFDGVDTELWKPRGRTPRRAGHINVPDHVKLVTYAARGFEAIRGFDIFMKFAKKLYQRRSDVRFIVIGKDRVCYGGDLKKTGGKSYKDWVMSQDEYDASKFAFVGSVAPRVLSEFFSITDLHVYLTAPFVLSWSLLNALSCGATVLASGTAPVREVIEHEKTGLLANFFDIDGLVEQACRVLDDPVAYSSLGRAGIELVREKYSLDVCLPQLTALFERTAARSAF